MIERLYPAPQDKRWQYQETFPGNPSVETPVLRLDMKGAAPDMIVAIINGLRKKHVACVFTGDIVIEKGQLSVIEDLYSLAQQRAASGTDWQKRTQRQPLEQMVDTLLPVRGKSWEHREDFPSFDIQEPVLRLGPLDYQEIPIVQDVLVRARQQGIEAKEYNNGSFYNILIKENQFPKIEQLYNRQRGTAKG